MRRRDFLQVSTARRPGVRAGVGTGCPRPRRRPPRRDRRTRHGEDGRVPRAGGGSRALRRRPGAGARVRGHQPRRSAADHRRHALHHRIHLEDHDGHRRDEAGAPRSGRPARASAQLPAWLPRARRRGQPHGVAVALPHAHAWVGRAAHHRGPRRRGAGPLRLVDHAHVAATGPAGRSVELQQRRLRTHRTTVGSGDRALDSRRAARAGVRAARAHAHVHAAHRRHHLPAVARPPRPRRQGRGDPPVPDHLEHHGRRRDHVRGGSDAATPACTWAMAARRAARPTCRAPRST